jgi:tetratricopeptide (TPR) repeat protein
MVARICEGVHHAHQRGLIHRDLKPGNILLDETGQPKILDFGVARVTDSEARATLQTDVGQLVGTLAYMSPEQALADPLDIDTRTDVYALGVILYELLSGKLPYPISKRIHETIQTIQEQDPAPLSTTNRNYRGDIETIVAKALEKDRRRRYASAAEMAADIQRHLNDEPIIARPQSAGYYLQKLARRHKAVVGGIAAVFAVLVGGIVVVSRSERLALRDRDWALEAEKRALGAEQARLIELKKAVNAEQQARRDRDRAVSALQRADTEAKKAKALIDFLRNYILTFPDPRIGTPLAVLVKPNPNLTVRETLDRASAGIAGQFNAQPLAEAELREAIAASYLSLGLYTEGQSHLKRAVELHRRTQGPAHPDTLKALKALLELSRRALFSVSQVEALQKEIVDIESQALGKEHPETLTSMESLARLYLSDQKYAEAEPLLVRIVAVRARAAVVPDLTSIRYMISLVESFERQGKSEKARQVVEKLEAAFRVLGEKNDITQAGVNMLFSFYLDNFPKRPETETLFNRTLPPLLSRISSTSGLERLTAMVPLVQVYQRLGKFEEADQLSVKVEEGLLSLGAKNPMMISGINTFKLKTGRSLPHLVDLVNAALPPPGSETLRDIPTIRDVALAYYDQGKYREAEALYTRAVDASTRLLSKEDPDSLSVRMTLAGLYVLEGKHDQAEESFVELVSVNRRASGPEARITLLALTLLGWSRLYQKDYAKVEADLREVLDSLEKVQPDEWERYNCQSILGAALMGQKRYAEAEPVLVSAYDGMTTRQYTVSRAYPLRPKLHKEAGQRIVQLYQDWGKPEKAAEWRDKLEAAEARAPFEPLRK